MQQQVVRDSRRDKKLIFFFIFEFIKLSNSLVNENKAKRVQILYCERIFTFALIFFSEGIVIEWEFHIVICESCTFVQVAD